MKASPVQLLQSTIEKLCVESNLEFEDTGTDLRVENVEIQVKEECQLFSEYWDDEKSLSSGEGIRDRTYRVRLSIRTGQEAAKAAPYAFDLVFAGVVACMPPRLNQFSPEQAARQYGFAMIYGAMREQFLTATSRMPHGPRLLPTVSFMEPDPLPTPPVLGAHESTSLKGGQEGHSIGARPKRAD